MKFTALFIVLTIASTMCVKTNLQSKLKTSSHMKQLQTTRWGQVAASFLEIQASLGSPVGDLIQAFQDFYHDVNFKVEIETFDFNVKEAEHNEWEAAIRERIASAKSDIAAATHSLTNVLYPRKAKLEDDIARDEQLIVDTKAEMVAATAQREANSAAHAEWIEQAQIGIEAINDCLDVLASFDGGAVSLIQMTKIKKHFQKVQKALQHTKFSTLIKALIKLADFTDSAMLQKLNGKFKDVGDSLAQGIVDVQNEEAAQQTTYEAFMALSAQTIADAEQRIVDNTAALEATNQEIADTEAFRAIREADLAVAEVDLENELARWANEVALFEKLMGELDHELEVIDQVIDIVSSLSVSEETMDRLNQ